MWLRGRCLRIIQICVAELEAVVGGITGVAFYGAIGVVVIADWLLGCNSNIGKCLDGSEGKASKENGKELHLERKLAAKSQLCELSESWGT